MRIHRREAETPGHKPKASIILQPWRHPEAEKKIPTKTHAASDQVEKMAESLPLDKYLRARCRYKRDDCRWDSDRLPSLL
ncbi:hypothetical protein AnigIFM56816_002879 [Aspergillus niger]|nr:hypothetical protein AnigIFM49718_009132 [Aspergillus niger]GKZ79010.1 hypothetical protein AnigIFM56816_002879 [Aspergillus niger]GLA36547.1 hypothetical protein AnigIFM63309_002738 [Aspergillus niger]